MEKLQPQRYLITLSPRDARIIFRVRSKMIDLRAVCQYMHQDVLCRLCGSEEESVCHVLNVCKHVEREDSTITVDMIYNGGDDDETNKMVARRIRSFMEMVEEKGNLENPSSTQEHEL